MDIQLRTPRVVELGSLAEALARWQDDQGAMHLHPGDLGWYSMRGSEATARALRSWSRGDELLAIGLLDGPDLLRLAVAPRAIDDESLAGQICFDIRVPERGVLPEGEAVVEARGAHALQRQMLASGWELDEPWTPLYRDLSSPLQDPQAAEAGLGVEVVQEDRAGTWMEVHWSAFKGTPFSENNRLEAIDWWMTMMSGPFADRGRSLVLVEPAGDMVAVAGIWTAGTGRPGLVEPMGVHRDHRGKGYGSAVCVAAAATLQQMGASSAVVCAESTNVGAVATYAAASFTPHPPVADLFRPS